MRRKSLIKTFTDAFKQISFVKGIKLRSINTVFGFVGVCTFGFQNNAIIESVSHYPFVPCVGYFSLEANPF